MKNVIAIRREDLTKKGEMRVAVTPQYLRLMVDDGHQVLVQPAVHPTAGISKRAHGDDLFQAAGAQIQEDISAANVVFGLKEIALEAILPDKTYYCFSHTHKGQLKNRKMLQTFVEQRSTLIDYELVTNAEGIRTVTAFTYYAGYAGMIDSMWTLGHRLETMGKSHPFSVIPQAVEYGDLGRFKALLAEIADQIEAEGTPADQPPLICLFLGNGKTSIGAQEMFDILPVQHIRPEEVPGVFESGSRHKVYSCILEIDDMFRPRLDSGIGPAAWSSMQDAEKRQAYFDHPQHFESNLEHVLPYATMLMNCTIWSSKYPRTVTRALMQATWMTHQNLIVIGDISCDPNGSIEFSQETWIDDPVYIYNPRTDASSMGLTGEGVAVMAVTNLPCEFSVDASEQFATDLAHVLASAAGADYRGTLEDAGLDDELKRGVILWQGQFTEKFAYMQEYLPSELQTR